MSRIELSDLHGPKTELRKSDTHLQYRGVGTSDPWTDLVLLTDLQGLPGVNGVENDAATAGYISAGISATKSALTVREYFTNVRDHGAVGDRVTDDTTAIQAALDATPTGGTCFVPTVAPGDFYKFTSLTIPHGVILQGAGWKYKRDNIQAFGGPNNVDGTTYYGSVMCSTATAGIAIATSAEGIVGQGGALRDILITGPGSGTSTGVALGLGAGDQGSFETGWKNVGIVNFANGATFTCVEDSDFSGLRIIACQVGLSLMTDSNQNSFTMLDIQRCGDGMTMDATCLANAFYSPIFQSNTGVSATLNGSQSVMVNPYFENSGGVKALEIKGYGHTIDAPVLSHVADGVNFDPASSRVIMTGVALLNLAPITIAGAGHVFIGDGRTITDNGSRTTIIDTDGATNRFSQIAIGNPLNTDGERFVIAEMSATGEGSSGGVKYRVGGNEKWKQYIAGGDAANLYLRDEANGRMLVTYTAGATAITSRVALNGLLQLPYVPTAGRPSAAAAGVGASIYDATIQCPVWSDGVNWRNGAGTIV